MGLYACALLVLGCCAVALAEPGAIVPHSIVEGDEAQRPGGAAEVDAPCGDDGLDAVSSSLAGLSRRLGSASVTSSFSASPSRTVSRSAKSQTPSRSGSVSLSPVVKLSSQSRAPSVTRSPTPTASPSSWPIISKSPAATKTSSRSTSQSPGASPSASVTPSQTQSPSPSATPSAAVAAAAILSTPQIVGVAVGSVLGAAAVCGAVVCARARRGKKKDGKGRKRGTFSRLATGSGSTEMRGSSRRSKAADSVDGDEGSERSSLVSDTASVRQGSRRFPSHSRSAGSRLSRSRSSSMRHGSHSRETQGSKRVTFCDRHGLPVNDRLRRQCSCAQGHSGGESDGHSSSRGRERRYMMFGDRGRQREGQLALEDHRPPSRNTSVSGDGRRKPWYDHDLEEFVRARVGGREPRLRRSRSASVHTPRALTDTPRWWEGPPPAQVRGPWGMPVARDPMMDREALARAAAPDANASLMLVPQLTLNDHLQQYEQQQQQQQHFLQGPGPYLHPGGLAAAAASLPPVPHTPAGLPASGLGAPTGAMEIPAQGGRWMYVPEQALAPHVSAGSGDENPSLVPWPVAEYDVGVHEDEGPPSEKSKAMLGTFHPVARESRTHSKARRLTRDGGRSTPYGHPVAGDLAGPRSSSRSRNYTLYY